MICNPVSREYIKIASPPPKPFPKSGFEVATYGFGASKLSGHYKIVVTCREGSFDISSHNRRNRSSGCQVYTLGTGLTLGTRLWRAVVPDSGSLVFLDFSAGAFLRGNLHGCAVDTKDQLRPRISCFDLEGIWR